MKRRHKSAHFVTTIWYAAPLGYQNYYNNGIDSITIHGGLLIDFNILSIYIYIYYISKYVYIYIYRSEKKNQSRCFVDVGTVV